MKKKLSTALFDYYSNRKQTLENAIKLSYDKVQNIKFGNAYYRHDIGARALKALD